MTTEKILVVEDEENLAQYIKFTLNNLGYDVPAVVSSGEDAIQKTSEFKPNLVLMDIVLKGDMDGIEAAERIRTIFDIPVIYLTGYTNIKTFKRAKIEEPFGYLLKPFQKRELHTAIEATIYRHRMERKLNESQVQFTSMLEIIEDGVIVTDKDGYITFMNSTVASMIRGNKKDVIGKNLGEIFKFRDQRSHNTAGTYFTCLVQNENNAGERNHAVLTRIDGLETQIEYRAASTKDEKGEVNGFFIVLPRIAESNHLNRELLGEHEELKIRFRELSEELEESKNALQIEINERVRAEEVFRQHFAELSRKNKYQTMTSDITHSIHKSIKIEETLESAVEVISNNLDNADNVSIFLVEGQDAILKAHRGYPDWFLEKMSRITYPKDIIWKTMIQENPLYLADLEQEMASVTDRKELGTKSFMSLPISSRGVAIGCINLHSTKENAFNEEELKLLEAIAKQIEIAINNAERVEALKQSEERYRISFNQSPIGLLIFDKELKITHCNERLSEILQYPQEKVIGLDMRNLEGLSSTSAIKSIFERESSRFETFLETTMASKSLWLSVSLSPLRSNDGEIMGGMAVLKDITQLKHIEDAFSEEKERLSVILQSIADGLIVTDTRGKIIIMNKVAEEITGWHKEETLNKSVEGVFLIINKKTRKLCENPVDKTIKTGWTGGLNKDTVLITRNKEEKFVSASGSPIRDKEGKIIGVVLVFRDITERKKIEEELLKNQKIESLCTLAEGIAHDFNNILTGILGNVSLAKMYVNPSDKIYKRLTEAERSCFKAAHLTKQLITFSTGGNSTRKVTSLKELLKVSTGFALRGSDVKSEFYIPEDLWFAEIDERQISQVIYNLVINAQQAMNGGGVIKVVAENVTIREGNELPVRDGRYVKITIEDKGVGISEENLPRVFDPYFTTKHKGSGLGLATAHSIIRNHDGYIGVESKPGEGTNFYVYLLATEESIPLEEEIIQQDPTEKTPDGNRAKILVMDDDEVIRKVLADILSHIGYEVEFAKEGSEATELYCKAKDLNEPFDAVILDLTIPGGMGGRETIRRLLDLDPGVKAIVSSGYSNDPVISDFAKYGFKGVVNKPYNIEELGKKIHEVINRENKNLN